MARNSPWVECGRGWSKLYEPLLAQCEQEGIEVLQVKEKFGGLRFYVGEVLPGSDIYERIADAERASFTVCEMCGEPGKLRRGGWVKTLCDKHAKGDNGNE